MGETYPELEKYCPKCFSDEVAFEKAKEVEGAIVYVRAYKSGRIECWAEPPIIDALQYVGQILEKFGIPYKITDSGIGG